MKTDKRLTQAYKSAKVVNFDMNSKYIFFSDVHRGDDSVSDEFTRNQHIFLHALNYYYENGYTYVEAGDGDELWEHPHFKHIRLAHKDIFIALKKFFDDNRLIMLYGNHNIYLKSKDFVRENYYSFYDEYNQKRVELFKGICPLEALLLKNKTTGQEILTVHGHQGDFMNDQFWKLSMLLLRYFWRFMHIVGFENPSSPARNYYKRHKVEKNYLKWIKKNKMMLICGHTHRPKFPKNQELPYFNTGCCINTRGIPGIEIIDNQILMVDWRITADLNGTMRIERNVVRGPEPIEKYDCKNNPVYNDYKSNCTEIEDDD
ncbi:serine/threonine protein phosphatase [Mobilitalea sibirica]|uniref:Serine/threonine protein phosphatase n=1 Tax=Mobilitalea sibirica TaxID=1462919 RepID=A0A8J7KSZ2_9FIRM|nr:serine/threonine protein phosphatase [Mobilitalea sibirica]MBH1940806.1 serine/threonine protein phosphatase [Mobilitalea sibirica]